jgi:hypothetical protein
LFSALTGIYLDDLDLCWSLQVFAAFGLPHFGALPSVALSLWSCFLCFGYPWAYIISDSIIQASGGPGLSLRGFATQDLPQDAYFVDAWPPVASAIHFSKSHINILTLTLLTFLIGFRGFLSTMFK